MSSKAIGIASLTFREQLIPYRPFPVGGPFLWNQASLWLGSKYQVDRITVRHVPVLSSSVQVVDSARDVGVVIDIHLTMVDHVTAVCRAAYFHLRQLRLITRSLSVYAAKTLVQSFITCHLDYCNALFSGITDSLFSRLQSVQNATRHRYSST